MRHTLYYSFNEHYNDTTVFEQDFKFMLDEKFDDIFEFEFENKYHKSVNYFTWYLEDGAKNFYKELESKWLTNSIDYYKYLQNPVFNDWIKQRYYEEALKEAYQKTLKYKNSYKDLTVAEYMEIYNENFEV